MKPNLLDGFWAGGFSPGLPVVPPKVNEVLEHEADSAAHLLVGDDLVDVGKVVVERSQILQTVKKLGLRKIARDHLTSKTG